MKSSHLLFTLSIVFVLLIWCGWSSREIHARYFHWTFTSIPLIALASCLILFWRSKEDAFVGRFIVATTLHLLAFLTVFAVWIYRAQSGVVLRDGLMFLAPFLFFLMAQSIYLLAFVRKM